MITRLGRRPVGKVFAHGLGSGQCFGGGMRGRGGVGILHDGRADRGFDVDGIIAVAFEKSVVVEHAAGAGSRFDGDSGSGVLVGGRMAGAVGRSVAAGAPKLGRVIVVVPPSTETPGMAGVPLAPVPAPPGPG